MVPARQRQRTPQRIVPRGREARWVYKQREAEADPDLGIVIEVICVGFRLQGRVLWERR